MIAELLALAALTWSDPSGDAHGAGDLTPPTAEAYSSLAPFDLVEVVVADEETLTLEVRLAGIPDPGRLPNGLTLPVIDLYLDTEEGGREELLPGVGMRTAPGRGWELAIRVHGDDAYLVRADDEEGATLPVQVVRSGDVLRIDTDLERPEAVRDLQALTGVYDPFSRDAWRPLSEAPSPWSFSSPTPAPPVVDLLAEDDAAQRDALRSYLLPARASGPSGLVWWAMMLVGLAVAVVGLTLRRWGAGDAAPAAGSQDTPSGPADVVDAADAAVVPIETTGDSDRSADAVDAGGSQHATSREPTSSGPASSDGGPHGKKVYDDSRWRDDGEARRARTTLSDGDGWWLHDLEDDDVKDDERETVWGEASGQGVQDASSSRSDDADALENADELQNGDEFDTHHELEQRDEPEQGDEAKEGGEAVQSDDVDERGGPGRHDDGRHREP